jgi:hypothetical protein
MRCLLIASQGEPLTATELATFTAVTGRLQNPSDPVEECWIIAGRRPGKSLGVAVLAAYLAACIDYRGVLARGERGVLPIMAASTQQAAQIFNFLKGIFTDNPRFSPLTEQITRDEISLRNRVDIQIRPASFRTIRGITAVAAIAEEASMWQSDESRNPDKEILAAVKPSLATTGGCLFAIGSPHARRGETWATFKKHFGANGNPAILVANGATRTFNPTIKQSVIDRAYEDDTAVAASEWGGQFRNDLESYISPDTIDACTMRDVTEIVPVPGVAYSAHCDPSSGQQDSFTLAIGHVEGEIAILDYLYERRPPFSPAAIVAEVCDALGVYGLATCTGDRYAQGFVMDAFASHGVNYKHRDPAQAAGYLTTSDNFAGLIPILNSGRCRLLDNKRLAAQLCALERRVSKVGGKDSISHPPGGHDDLGAAVAGLMVRLFGTRDYQIKSFHVPPPGQGRSAITIDPQTSLPANVSRELYGAAGPSVQPGLASGPEYGGGGDHLTGWTINSKWVP